MRHMQHTALLLAAAAVVAGFAALTQAAAEPSPMGLAVPSNAAPGATKIQFATPPALVFGNRSAGYNAPYPRDGIAACQRRFRSFDPETGTYMTRSGEQVLCPYLRS